MCAGEFKVLCAELAWGPAEDWNLGGAELKAEEKDNKNILEAVLMQQQNKKQGIYL